MAIKTFFTPLCFENRPTTFLENCQEAVDHYFYLGGKKIYVFDSVMMPNTQLAIRSHSSPWSFEQKSPSLTMTVLKVISYVTLLLPLILLIAKGVLRLIHRDIEIVSMKQVLAGDDQIPPEAIAAIEEHIVPQAASLNTALLKPHPAYTYLPPHYEPGNNFRTETAFRRFTLTACPGLVFQFCKSNISRVGGETPRDITKERFAHMVRASEVRFANHLANLTVPRAKLFEVGGITMIAQSIEELLHESVLEERFQQRCTPEVAEELATFVAITGFSDVEWRNLSAKHLIELTHLAAMTSPALGIFGAAPSGTRGLVRCLSEPSQMERVLAMAAERDIHPIKIKEDVTPQQIRDRRLSELQNNRALITHYETKGILQNPRQQIIIPRLESLELNLNQTANSSISEYRKLSGPYTLREATTDFIHAINQALKNAPQNATLKGQRLIYLPLNYGPLAKYSNFRTEHLTLTSGKSANWVRRILIALKNKGHLFEIVKLTRSGVTIQI